MRSEPRGSDPDSDLYNDTTRHGAIKIGLKSARQFVKTNGATANRVQMARLEVATDA